MDPLSQAVVGALGAGALVAAWRRPQLLRPALVVGAVGGMVPDLDIVIRSDSDPLVFLQYHRHFTHALIMAPVMGALAAVLALPLVWLARWQLGWRWLWALATAGALTHGPLDAMTNYGTHLFWPFTHARESWNMISIIDPIFTFTLLFLLLGAAIWRAPKAVVAAVIFAFSYWGLGAVQHQRAVAMVLATAAERGEVAERVLVNPSLGNLLAWRGQYQNQGRIVIDGYHLGFSKRRYEGGVVPLFNGAAFNLPLGSAQAKGLDFVSFFANGWLAPLPNDPLAAGDMRFGALPTSTNPLWGFKFTPETPNQAVQRAAVPGRNLNQLPDLWAMVRGADLPSQ